MAAADSPHCVLMHLREVMRDAKLRAVLAKAYSDGELEGEAAEVVRLEIDGTQLNARGLSASDCLGVL